MRVRSGEPSSARKKRAEAGNFKKCS